MILSELVQLKILVNQYQDIAGIRREQERVTANIKSLITDTLDSDLKELVYNNALAYEAGVYQIERIAERKLEQFNEVIDAKIAEIAKPVIENPNTFFGTHIEDDRHGRRLPISNDIHELVLGRIRIYIDWRFPGLEICCRDGEYTDYLVGMDPLYLVDLYKEYLDITKSHYPPEYQARLRTYQIGDIINTRGFVELPQNEFGFIFCWNVFNHFPHTEIYKYLTGIEKLLRPGGTAMFSFNDSSSYIGTLRNEWGGMKNYTPKAMILGMIKDLGLELSYSYSFDAAMHNISWLEVKKPGELTTIKAHQTLGLVQDIK